MPVIAHFRTQAAYGQIQARLTARVRIVQRIEDQAGHLWQFTSKVAEYFILDREVVLRVADMAIDQRDRYDQRMLRAVAQPHDLEIVTRRRKQMAKRRRPQDRRQIQHDLFKRGQRCEADAERRVVGDACRATGVHLLQARAAFLDLGGDEELLCAGPQLALQIVGRRGDNDFADIEPTARVRCTPADDQLGGLDDSPAAEARFAAPGDQQTLVDVEMQHLAEALPIHARECERRGLAARIGDRVGVPDTLVLAHLGESLRAAGRRGGLNDDG